MVCYEVINRHSTCLFQTNSPTRETSNSPYRLSANSSRFKYNIVNTRHKRSQVQAELPYYGKLQDLYAFMVSNDIHYITRS